MELFYSNNIADGVAVLSPEESAHCVKVLRHRAGDEVCVSGGDGNLYRCRIIDADVRGARLEILSVEGGFGTHDYRLWMAVAPTKNADRFEWFAEKAVEMGVDRITPVLCAHSERKVYNHERGGRLVVAAAKQSLKGMVPRLDELTPFGRFISEAAGTGSRKFIAYCDVDIVSGRNTRISLAEAADMIRQSPDAVFLIGPEGDFSSEEIGMALEAGFLPLSLGPSRLRTETAALLCVASVYSSQCCR